MLPSFITLETTGKLVQEDLKTSRTTTGDGEKHRPIADQHNHSNNPKNNIIVGHILALFPFSFLKQRTN